MKQKNDLLKRQHHNSVSGKQGRWFVLFRYFIVVFFFIAVFVMVPLMIVGKQVYITNVSMHQHRLSDSLVVLQKEAVALNIMAEKLLRTERIEQIARESLGLEYPASQEIVVIRPGKTKTAKKYFSFDTPLWIVLKKSMIQVRG